MNPALVISVTYPMRAFGWFLSSAFHASTAFLTSFIIVMSATAPDEELMVCDYGQERNEEYGSTARGSHILSYDGLSLHPFEGSSVNSLIGADGGESRFSKEGPPGVRRPGTPGDEALIREAIKRAVDWLTRHQNSDGSWDGRLSCDRCACRTGGRDQTVGVTALALLALIRTGCRNASVDRASDYLLAHQDGAGRIGHASTQPIKNHLWATLALLEIVNRRIPLLVEEEATKGLQYAILARTHGKGWGPTFQSPVNKFSITGWGFEILRLDKVDAGHVPFHVAVFLNYVSSDSRRLPTALRLLGRTAFQYENEEESNQLAMSLVDVEEPLDYETAYFVTRALQTRGDEPWRRWNAILKEAILAKQNEIRGDCRFGSWTPVHLDEGRVYATAMAILALQAVQKAR